MSPIDPNSLPAWPASTIEQLNQIEAAIATAPRPLTAAELAEGFTGVVDHELQAVLNLLTGLGRVDRDGDCYRWVGL